MRRRSFLSLAVLSWAATALAADPPSLVLVTLDTTRADHVGRVVDGSPLTPRLDALARSGVRFTRAIAPAPLTLPAHCTLMTGLNPPAHGVRDNGAAALPADLPTLAAVLSGRGYATGAVVASLVLDRRFGLDRGFAAYDDGMIAERAGEQGYPERDAAAVTDAALAWAASLPAGRPWFLWVHYYDPHAPYEPPGSWKGASAARRYAGEVARVDREVGRLLDGLPSPAAGRMVAVVGDHGEMLGEHGEKEHGLFLYRAALDVPLILAGPGLPAGGVVSETVGTRALAATLLALLGFSSEAGPFGAPLPGVGRSPARAAGAPVYSETLLPETAYGWSPLRAATDGRFRLISAPRPELYDLVSDPEETRNLFASRRDEARRLQAVVVENERLARRAPPAESAELAESLRNLGYLSGSSRRPGGGMDPKDGLALLEEFDRAKALTRDGLPAEAVRQLTDLVRKSPGNVPFLVRLAEAQSTAGNPDAALATLREAIALNPRLDFLHAHAARLQSAARRDGEAKAEWEAALALNPRYAPAWLGLAEIASRAGAPAQERAILERGEASGTRSAAILDRLAQLELAAGETAAAGRHAEEAVRRMPAVGATWWVAGEVEEKKGNTAAALDRFQKAAALGYGDPRSLVHLGRLLLENGRAADARAILERAIALGPGTASAEDARRLLEAP
jgi:tetratricopeptide (TPR) repeat protein